MASHNKLGKTGEEAAIKFLKNKNYQIKERNWRYSKLEIDIIALFNEQIIFIEVKSRSGTYFEHPSEAVTKKKQRFIIKAANAYIEKHNIDLEARFDIISIVNKENEMDIEHIQDAFYPMV